MIMVMRHFNGNLSDLRLCLCPCIFPQQWNSEVCAAVTVKRRKKSLTKQVCACLPLPVCGHILCRGIRPLPALLFDGPGCEELDRSEVRGRGGVGLMTQR